MPIFYLPDYPLPRFLIRLIMTVLLLIMAASVIFTTVGLVRAHHRAQKLGKHDVTPKPIVRPYR